MIKVYLLKLVSTTAIIFLFCMAFLSCAEKDPNEVEKTGKSTKLVFNVFEEDLNTAVGQVKAKLGSSGDAVGETLLGQDQHIFISDGSIRLTGSLVETSASAGAGNEISKIGMADKLAGLQKVKAQSALGNDIKYRVLLYDRSTTPSTFVSSTLGTAGTPLSIEVEKGKEYDWAVFSYNDQNDPGISNTTVPSDQRDLLHTRGTTGVIPGIPGDNTPANVPINVVLQHKLAAVTIELNSTNYPAVITAASAALGSPSYFFSANMAVKTGALSTPTSANVTTAINLGPVTEAAVKWADFYTASSSVISNFSVLLNSLTIRDGLNQVKTSKAPVTFNWNNVSPAPGKKYIAKINVQPVKDISGTNFKILSLGSAPHTLMNDSRSGLYKAMHSTSNFGPNGIFPTTNLNWNITYRGAGAGGLSDAATGNYKMIFVGYATGLSNNDVVQLRNYVTQGGTVIFFTENPGSGTDQAVWRTYAGTAASYASFGTFGNFNQNPLLNGPFGDARGTSFGDQALVGYGTTNFIANNIDVLATNSSASGTAVVWKAKNNNFYYFGDGGMQYINDPFLLTNSPAFVPRIGTWTGRNNVSNSVVIMNILARTINKL